MWAPASAGWVMYPPSMTSGLPTTTEAALEHSQRTLAAISSAVVKVPRASRCWHLPGYGSTALGPMMPRTRCPSAQVTPASRLSTAGADHVPHRTSADRWHTPASRIRQQR